MTTIFTQNLDSRLYVDLIYRASSQYASFNPSSKIELGDYGFLNKKTGEFVVEGNIFERFPELSSKRETAGSKGTMEKHKQFFSSRGNANSNELHLDASIPSLVDCSFKGGWSYERDRHAALVMVDPVLYEIPYEGSLYDLIAQQEDLRKKALVTKLYKCSSFANLLTNGRKGKAFFGFNASLPIPVTVPLSLGGGPDFSWKTFAESGAWSTGVYRAGEYPYTPLMTLRSIRKIQWASSFKGAPEAASESTQLPMQLPPWGELTDTGVDLDGDLDADEEDDDDDDDVNQE